MTYRKVIEQAQKILSEHITPDSKMSRKECINQLLSVLDNQELVRKMKRK